jgi:hypothetical protein
MRTMSTVPKTPRTALSAAAIKTCANRRPACPADLMPDTSPTRPAQPERLDLSATSYSNVRCSTERRNTFSLRRAEGTLSYSESARQMHDFPQPPHLRLRGVDSTPQPIRLTTRQCLLDSPRPEALGASYIACKKNRSSAGRGRVMNQG